MKGLIYSLLICTLILFHGKAFAQSLQLDSIQIERIVKTSQLWGHLKYFHPNLSDNAIDWESAFTDNIEGVIKAKNTKDYGKAIQKMLDVLNDAATQILMQDDNYETEDTLKYPVIKFVKDSVLLVSIRDYRDLEDYNYALQQFTSLKEMMPISNGVIFDIRSSENLGSLKGYLSWYFARIEQNFTNEEIQFPGLRARFHDGFVPETGGTSGGYYSGFYTKNEKRISPEPTAVEKPYLFIVNEHAEIPMIALALQMVEKAKIISTGPLTDASLVETYNYWLDDSLEVMVRQNELPPGTTLKADHMISPNTKEGEIMNSALQLMRGHGISTARFQDSNIETTIESGPESRHKKNTSYPDLGHRLLAAAKIWTVIDYFFAYKDLMEEDWDEVLKEFIPRLALASDSLEYNLAVAEMYENLQDGHGFIRSKVLNGYFGQASPPVKIRFIEEQAVVVGLLPDSVFNTTGVDIGDIILAIDGESTGDRFDRYAKYTATSNPSWLRHSIARRFLNGEDSTDAVLKIQKAGGQIESVTIPRNNRFNQYLRQLGNDRNNEAITRHINERIGYADLDRLTPDMVDKMFDEFADTKAIIFDMRGYPNGTAWSIAPYLTDKENVYAASFQRYSPMGMNFGSSEHKTFFNQAIPAPKFPTYTGKTVMLIDERTVSQAEHTGLFFEAANGTKFIGSQTAGANGDVTNFQIPGNIILFFSGHDVRHIDGRQLQKTGLVPDVEVKPSIKGIRVGKDEVLDRAVEFVEGLIKQ